MEGERDMDLTIDLNGSPLARTVRPNETLLDLLRDQAGLHGAVEACGVGVCGSCTVLVDDRAVSSCLMLAANLDGAAIRTVEGLATDRGLDPIQEAFLRFQAFQCGYCTSGMIMMVKALLLESPSPSEDEIRDYLGGNICRCGTYEEVVKVVVSLRGPEQPAP
jgi:carbon-monoxide dehydrogenase small subunit